MPAALRHFRVVILTQIGVERNERVIEKIALDPDPRGVAGHLRVPFSVAHKAGEAAP